MCDLLEYVYPRYQLLKGGSERFPVVTFSAPAEQRREVDSVLGNLSSSVREQEELVVDDERYLRLVRGVDRTLWNGPTYVMERLTLKPRLQVDCALGWYFDSLRSCDSLEWELLKALGKGHRRRKGGLSGLSKELSLRRRLHKIVDDPVRSGHGRSAALACSTLVVFNDGREWRVLLRQRSSTVAVHRQLYHVIPSFMMQPLMSSYEREYSVVHNVLREFGEELFDIDELVRDEGHVAFDWFYEQPPVRHLRELLDSGEAQLLLTGLAVNLLNLRPEICTLLLIFTPDWYRMHARDLEGAGLLQYNWEFASSVELCRGRMVPLSPPGLDSCDDLLSFNNAVPPGAATYYLGSKVAADVLVENGPIH